MNLEIRVRTQDQSEALERGEDCTDYLVNYEVEIPRGTWVAQYRSVLDQLSEGPVLQALAEAIVNHHRSLRKRIPTIRDARICPDCGQPPDERYHNPTTGRCLGRYR